MWEDKMSNLIKRGGTRHFSQDDVVAGNGLLHRRALLGRGLMMAGAAGVGFGSTPTSAGAEPLKEPEWSRFQGTTVEPIGRRTKYEKNTVRTLSNPNGEPRTQHARAPLHLLNGTITPSHLHFTILHNGIPDIDPDQHKLVVHGMVKNPMVFTMDKLMRYPMVTRQTFVECGGNSSPMFSKEPVQANLQQLHGLVSNSEWTGVLLSTILDEVGIDPKAVWMLAEGADTAAITRSIPLKKALDDAILVMYQNGERLMAEQGFPLRLLLPGWEGNMNIKYIRRLKITDQPAMTYYEERNYSPVLPDYKAYRFYFVNEVKSFITHPSFGAKLDGPGYYEISGIAYSGTGRIERVLVSADGGKSWADAAVQGPTMHKAFTRFHIPWRWDGQPAVITSRAIDDGGNVQPLRADFVKARGETLEPIKNTLAFYSQHYNSLTSWGINAKGEISHVYV
jgi:sulfane dehydrogenase subunit SoxC